GDAHVIQVKQRQLAHATARQRLGHPAAYPADTNHRHVRGLQAGQAVASVQPGNSTKTLIIKGHCATSSPTGRALYVQRRPQRSSASTGRNASLRQSPSNSKRLISRLLSVAPSPCRRDSASCLL